ncbi:MAG: AzlD domain-containing protein [Firmicutes bacterium]|nr:AzlD domain-containing protein [Bacillota bacterium]
MPVLLLIAGMAVVTYIPRLLPFLLLTGRTLPPAFKRFLAFIPYTALGALIIPGVIEAIPGHPWISLAGLTTAVVIAWFRGGLILPVVTAVGTVFLLLAWLGR